MTLFVYFLEFPTPYRRPPLIHKYSPYLGENRFFLLFFFLLFLRPTG